MAAMTAPRHRELARGMVSELDAIVDPTERRRFAFGAIAAMLQLAVSGYIGQAFLAPGQIVGAFQNPRGPSMPRPDASQLLRRHMAPLAISLGVLTTFLLVNFARQVPRLSPGEVTPGTMAEALMLAVPFILAMTIPMAVFLAVSWVFTRLGADGTLAEVRRQRGGLRRLLAPVCAAAFGVAALTLVSNTQVLPHANLQLATLLSGRAQEGKSDRTMTIGELREAAGSARASAVPDAASRAVAYEVEIQKKFALAAASIVLALAGAAIALRFPRGGMGLVIGAGVVVFVGYYGCLIAGEALAERQVISPFVAMWMANAVLLIVASLLVWRPGEPRVARGAESLAISG